jgi:hypothetical protein
MATIIAGVFDTTAETLDVETELHAANIAADNISVFALNPPGQHALYPIGGDEDADHGARHAHTGALSGTVIGASAGLGLGAVTMAATGAGPVVAVAAAAAGAYTGSLIGALNKLGETAGEKHSPGEKPGDTPEETPHAGDTRHAGTMIAVNAENAGARTSAVGILQAHGAKQVEQAEGTWRDGEWVDFDPRTTPRLIAAGNPAHLQSTHR